MGFFGKKKTTIVSSTVYNMAGEEEDRPNFLKNSIYASVMSDWNPFLGETLVGNYLNGPGINQRKFFNYCVRQNYPGLPTYNVTRNDTIDPAIVANHIPTPETPAGLLLNVMTAHMTSGDYEHVVEEWVLENFPENYNTDYVTAYDITSNTVIIQWVGGGSEQFSAGTYSSANTYIVANYYHYLPSETEDLVTGSTTTGVLTKPSTVGYILDSSSNTGVVNYPMNYSERVVTTYTGVPVLPSDTDVTTTGLSDSPGFDGLDETWTKTTYEGGDGESEEVVNREHFLEISEYREVYTANVIISTVVNENTPDVGQTETIVTWRQGDNLRPIWDWRIDTEDTFVRSIIDGSHMFIYEIGDGITELDDLLDEAITAGAETEYFPYLPVRLDNDSITHHHYDDDTGSGLYTKTNRAYRRATGGYHAFTKLIDQVEDNDSIDDIDFAFVHFGVGLNVLEPACRKYMYIWLKTISTHQKTNSGYMDAYKAEVATYTAEQIAMDLWIYAQGDPARDGYGDARPNSPKLNAIQTTTVRLKCDDNQLANLDNRVTWVNITETLHSGVGRTGAETGDIWWQGYEGDDTPDPEGDDFFWQVFAGVVGKDGSYEGGVKITDYETEKVKLYWQTGANTYKKLTCHGLIHHNLVYNGEAVEIPAREALGSDDPTGFIIPLNYTAMRDMGLVDATQMSTANTFIIFNTYEVVKQKWYQTFIGMIIIIIVIVVITVVTGGLGAGSVGLLGTNLAVGTAIGLTGSAAILAGAIINAIVAIIVSKIVGFASAAIFGDRIGAIVAVVINLAISFGTSGADFSSIAELGTAANILKITAAVANGYSGYTQGAIAEIGDELIENKEVFESEMKKIENMLRKLRGNNDLNFDPLRLTDSVKGNDLSSDGVGYITETLDGFIHRTTMTGSDIVSISLSMVNDYAKLSLKLP